MAALRARMEAVILGKSEVIEKVLVCLLAGGHVLLEDLPGMGKTTLAYALARALDGSFQRIQFTSDLLPADVLGVSVFNDKVGDFEFRPGPVFANILLADEINRTTPKTQSALLEVMDRGRVSIEGESRSVGRPFMVFATQNPVDYEGTFPLPDSQLDRFFMRLEIGYPDPADEFALLQAGHRHYDDLEQQPVCTLTDVLSWQAAVDGVYVEPSVLTYLHRLVLATRHEAGFVSGVSPRGALALKAAAQARALYHGRDYVLPADVARLLAPVCGHRLRTPSRGGDPLEERRRIEGLLARMVEALPEPL